LGGLDVNYDTFTKTLKFAACRLGFVSGLGYNSTTNNESRSAMNLEEYKSHVEAQRKASLQKAIATMSEANDTMSSLFGTKEAN
jgi:hypothetical protein